MHVNLRRDHLCVWADETQMADSTVRARAMRRNPGAAKGCLFPLAALRSPLEHPGAALRQPGKRVTSRRDTSGKRE